MFKKIVSNLSFSPAVAGQLTFYARRLRKEKLTRGLSVIFGIGVFALQFANIVAPATNVNASGPSDIMPGGFAGQTDMVGTCRTNTFIQVVYGYFGITCDNIAAGSFQYIPAQNSTWLSLGRTRVLDSDTAVVIGDNTFYLRPLSEVAFSPTGRAIVGTSSWGHPFAILISCGNPVLPEMPTPPPAPAPAPPPPPTPPSLVLHKYAADGYPAAGSTVSPGTLLGFRMPYGNGGQTGAYTTQIIDNIPAGATFVSQSSHLATNFQAPSKGVPATWTIQNLPPGGIDNAYIVMKVKDDVADGTKICNAAIIRAVYVLTITSEQVCYTVKRNAPPPPVTPPPPTTPPPVTPPPKLPNINQSKFAVYLTRSQDNHQPLIADKTTAKSGDIIEYTIKTSNTGDGVQKNYPIVEDLTDVLEYADITNFGGGTLQGKSLTWAATNVGARTTITKSFQVTVKTPVPSTPRSTSDPQSFDLCMNNVYGDSVNICVEAPPVKQVEATTESLPQTGPGLGIGLVAGFAALIVFFYMRNKQLQTEVQILRVDNIPGV